MKEQFKALIGIIIKPKQTLLFLPSNKFYIFSFLISLYFGYARAVRKNFFNVFADQLDSNFIPYIIFLILGIAGFLFGAFIIKIIVRLFGKKLTLRKIMNIQGYIQTPRLILSIPISILFFILPVDFKTNFLLGEYKWLLVCTSVLGLILLLYSLFLLIYGLKISPSYSEDDKIKT